MGRVEGKVAIVTGAGSGIGRAGAIAFQSFSGSIDANGVETDDYSLRFVRPPGHMATGVSCQVVNLIDFSGNGVQYCPLFGQGYAPDGGPSYSPDGQSSVFSGAVYQNDGSRTPPRSGCPGSCETIVLTAADGSSPRLLPVAIADAAGIAVIGLSRTQQPIAVVRFNDPPGSALFTERERIHALVDVKPRTDIVSTLTMECNKIAAQIPVRRAGVPRDIANVIAFLCSDDASFVSGQVIYVAGGPRG